MLRLMQLAGNGSDTKSKRLFHCAALIVVSLFRCQPERELFQAKYVITIPFQFHEAEDLFIGFDSLE